MKRHVLDYMLTKLTTGVLFAGVAIVLLSLVALTIGSFILHSAFGMVLALIVWGLILILLSDEGDLM